MDLRQFSSTNKNETFLLEIVKLSSKVEKNIDTKAQETLKFKMTKPKQNFNFDHPLNIPENR